MHEDELRRLVDQVIVVVDAESEGGEVVLRARGYLHPMGRCSMRKDAERFCDRLRADLTSALLDAANAPARRVKTASRPMISKPMRRVMEAIPECLRETETAPTLAEVAAQASMSETVTRSIIDSLIGKGYLKPNSVVL